MSLALVVAALVAAAPAVVAPRPFTLEVTLEGITEYRLPNGLKVVMVPDPSKPTVTVNLTVFVGSRHENYGEKGMAHLFEHMLFKRTKHVGSIKEELTRLGGMANGTTWLDRTNYYESFAADDTKLARAIELESERLRSAIISRDELATEMTVVRNEFEIGENQPFGVAMKRMLGAAYMWHSYGNETIGPRSDIEKVPNERLLNWYETYYQPDNAMLVIAGRFDQAKAFKVIADTFGKMPKPKRVLPQTYTDEPTQDGENSVVVRRVGGTPLFLVGYHMPATTDPDAAALDALVELLGASPAGRLYGALVDAKKAAEVQCFTFPTKDPGMFMCSASLGAKDQPGPARDALAQTIEQLKPPTKEELDRAKSVYMKNLETLLNSPDRVGISLSEYAAMGDWRMLFVHRDRVAALTTEDVGRVAAKYFKASNRTLVEYVPTEHPDRAEVPLAGNLEPVLKAFKGSEGVVQGEAFDVSPKNLEARTKRSTLPSGAKVGVLAKKTRGETVSVVVMLKYGAEKSLMNLGEAPDFAAKMLLRGTTTRTRQQVTDEFDRLHAEVSIGARAQTVVARIEVRRPQLDATLDLLADCLKTPRFDAKEFELLRREEQARLEQSKDEPDAIGFTALQRLQTAQFARGHALYTPTIPEQIADVAAVKVEQARDVAAKFFGAGAAFIGVVGDVDADKVVTRLTAQYGSWKSPEAYVRIPEPFVSVAPSQATIAVPDKAGAFYAATLSVKLKDTDADFPAMAMADFMLGGGFLTGRISQRLREKEGLSYGVGTYLQVDPFSENAALNGYAIYAPQNGERVERGFLDELQKAVEGGFTAEELTRAKEGFLRDRESARSDDGRIASQLASWLEVGRPLSYSGEIDDRLRALKIDEVNAALKRHVDPKRLATVKAGDFKTVAAPR